MRFEAYLVPGLWAAAIAILVYVAYRTGLLRAYIAYWGEAAKQTAEGFVSAKRAVFIHGAAGGFLLVGAVLYRAGWVFTKESLDAFNTLMLCTVGGYVGGKFAEVVTNKVAAIGQDKTNDTDGAST